MLRRRIVVTLFALGALACAAGGLRADITCIPGPEVAKRVDTVMKTYAWSSSLEELKKRAADEKKLIFFLQLVGELDGGL
jgi:hypothetical protein